MIGKPEGIDVSNHQGVIAWPEVANANIAFAFIKATEGTGFADKFYPQNVTQAQQQGILAGPYHYFRPSLPPVAQADFFARQVNRAGRAAGLIQPVLDLEETDGMPRQQVIDAAHQYGDRIHQIYGRYPILYTYPYFFTRVLGDPVTFAHDYPLWIARYGSAPMLLGGWNFWTFWQYTATGHVSGISTIVDRNQFNGGLTQLQKFVM